MAKNGCVGWLLLAWMLVGVAGCSEPPASSGRDAATTDASTPCDASWPCPEGWVRGASGGCGPAVLLCAPDGGAARDACDLDALRSPQPFPAEDGGTGWRFGLLPDGAITGGWSERMPPCAEGWSRLDDGSCVPVLRECAAGSSAIPGGGCTTTAVSDCPSGRFPPTTPEMMGRALVYVDANAPPTEPDGSEQHPLRAVAEAVAGAPDGAFVLVAAGVYEAPVEATRRVTIVGVCAARVTFGRGQAIALQARGQVALRGVTVHGGAIVPGALDARAVTFRGGDGTFALRVETSAGRGTFEDVRVEMSDGYGVQVVQEAQVTLRAFGVEGGGGIGVYVSSQGALRMFDGAIHDVRLDRIGKPDTGYAVRVMGRGQVDAERLALDRNQVFAVQVTEPGSRFTLRGGVIRDTRPVAGGAGKALQADDHAEATLDGVRVSGNANTAASAFTGGTLTVRDCVVLDTQERPNGTAGRGLDAHHSATLHVERTRIEGMRDVALFSYDGSRVTVRDVLIRRTRVPSRQGFGAGLAAVTLPGGEGTTTLDARRVLVEDSAEEGFAAIGTGTEATLEDVIVRGVLPSARGFAIGALTSGGAHLTARRVAVVGTRGIGFGSQQYGQIIRAAGTRMTAQDIYVRAVAPGQIVYSITSPDQPPAGTAAYGFVAGEATENVADRVLIEDTETGIAALSPLTIRGIVIVRARLDGVVGRSRVEPARVRIEGVACGIAGPLRITPDDTLGDPQVQVSRPP